MTKHTRLLIVVADGEHARFIRRSAGNNLHTETAFDSTALHKQSSDLGSDRPGASMHTGSTAHHALAPRHDPKTLEKMKFAGFVARQITAGEGFDTLVLAAPPHILHEIRAALTKADQDKIIGTVPKDLVKTPLSELWAHIEDWLPPVVTS